MLSVLTASARKTAACVAGALALAVAAADPPAMAGDTGAGPPMVTQLRIAPRSFRVGYPARISFRLDAPARVSLRFDQARPGRRRGPRCVLLSPQVRTGTPCTVHTYRGAMFVSPGPTGVIRLTFRGRLVRPQGLPPGNYRLTATANSSASRPTAARRAFFRLLPARR